MEQENESNTVDPKDKRVLSYYFLVVLLLGLVAIGVLVRAFDTAFVERDKGLKGAQRQHHPNH